MGRQESWRQYLPPRYGIGVDIIADGRTETGGITESIRRHSFHHGGGGIRNHGFHCFAAFRFR